MQETVGGTSRRWRRGLIVPIAAALFLASWGTLAAGASPSGETFTPASAGPAVGPVTPGHLTRGTGGSGRIKIVNLAPSAKASLSKGFSAAAASQSLAMFQQSENYPAGNPYNYTMVGGSPFTAGAGTTTITTPVIPIKFQVTGVGTISDASATASDCGQTLSAASLTKISPLFQNVVQDPEGNHTQYVDALQRGNFNQQTQTSGISPNYHLLFNPTSPGTLTITVPIADAAQFTTVNCGTLTGVDFTWFFQNFPTFIQNLVTGGQINPTQMPLFVMYNTILCGNSACSSGADGYHFVSPTTAGQQVYAVADYDLTGDLTSIDSMAESHEFAEATDDPLTANPVPTWGHVGQDPSTCQQNLETGDPLDPGFPGSPSSIADTYTVSSVSHTFHFQDEAYHSWFFREASPPSSKNVSTMLGSGPYSMFGFFSAASDSTVCPGQPTGVTAVPGNGQARVSWTAGPGPVTGYAVIPYIGAAPQTPQLFNSTATTETVTGLTNKTNYTFTVLARHTNSSSGSCPFNQLNNTIGTGFDCSTESLPSSGIVAGTPIAPTGVSASAISGGASVSWTAPAQNNGSPISGYVITPFLNGVAEAPDTFNSNATKENVTGLTKGQHYTFKVAAINGNGTGINSIMSNSVAPK
jgi:hypothetical protein